VTISNPQCACSVSRHSGHQVYHSADCWVTSLVGAHREIERLTRERDEAKADYLRRHHEYMDYRYGSEGLPEGAELTINRLQAALERINMLAKHVADVAYENGRLRLRATLAGARPEGGP
jgi:hypothetical protein